MIDPIPTGPDGKPRLGRFGELLDENGIQILGEILSAIVHKFRTADTLPDARYNYAQSLFLIFILFNFYFAFLFKVALQIASRMRI